MSWWPPALHAEVESLSRQVDALASERDDLAEQLARTTQSRDDLRAAMRAAYEPAQSEQCRKIRYLHREDAERHAIDVADRTRDHGSWNAYQCRWCPPHPGYRTQFWHVGHCRDRDAGAIRVVDGAATYSCGCVFSVRLDEMVWRCDQHEEREAS